MFSSKRLKRDKICGGPLRVASTRYQRPPRLISSGRDLGLMLHTCMRCSIQQRADAGWSRVDNLRRVRRSQLLQEGFDGVDVVVLESVEKRAFRVRSTLQPSR